MSTLKGSILALTLMVTPGIAFAHEVIVSSQNSAPLSKDQVEKIYTGKTASFPGGLPVAMADNAALRETFYKAVAGKSGDQARTHWAKLEFTGKAKAPTEVPNGKAVVEFVAKNPGGIGYVEKADVGAGVKVVLTVQ